MTHPHVLILDIRHSDPNFVGFIPTFLDLNDPRPAKEQFAERYEYGGWRNQEASLRSTERQRCNIPATRRSSQSPSWRCARN
jgi:hypothetical protein